LAAFWRLRRAFHACFLEDFTRMCLLLERAISLTSGFRAEKRHTYSTVASARHVF
jgi:hypothetical protein